MTNRRQLPEATVRALSHLLELVSRDAGFVVRGAPGWATAEQIHASTKVWSTPEIMRLQARLGRVHEHDGRVDGQLRAQWLYRVTQRGADDLARTLGVPAASIPDLPRADEPGVLLPESARNAIEALRGALDEPIQRPKEWVHGELGWRSSFELTLAMDRELARTTILGRYFTSEDLRWLVKHGLADRRVIGHIHIYRLSEAGAAIRTIDWREPADGA